MAIRFKLNRKAQRTLGLKSVGGKLVTDTSYLVDEVRKAFSIQGPKKARQAVLRDLGKGISPVDGQDKYEKYSKSYKKVISGKGMFRTINGKPVYFEGVSDPNLSAASGTKRTSPVNLRFTGQLWNSLKTFTTGGSGIRFRLVFDWRDFLADIHNRRGASKKKVIRRMLPTESNETFNSEILDKILEVLVKAADKVAKRFS